ASGNGSASARGVLRDQHGNWILEFNHFLRRCSVSKAELLEILDGLLVLLSEGFKMITIQTDSSITMPTRFQRIMRTEEQWCVKYVLREFNQVADCLAKLSFVEKTSLQVYDDAPNEVSELIQQNKANDAFV
ncbi:hypothetical protein Goshw_006856, partial [Gossypium schwendimanii]|nr:hypothetical protein [Gossypium schwendimanii]